MKYYAHNVTQNIMVMMKLLICKKVSRIAKNVGQFVLGKNLMENGSS